MHTMQVGGGNAAQVMRFPAPAHTIVRRGPDGAAD
jgi:hypothetical protein